MDTVSLAQELYSASTPVPVTAMVTYILYMVLYFVIVALLLSMYKETDSKSLKVALAIVTLISIATTVGYTAAVATNIYFKGLIV